MPRLQLSCLHTTIRSLLSTTKTFPFLGKHGMRLGPNEQVMIPGDVWDQAAKNQRKFDGLQHALNDDMLVIVRSPEVHIFDGTADRTRTIRITNGTLSAVDPCWGQFVSAEA